MKHIRTQAAQASLAHHGKTPFARSALVCALLAVSAAGAKAEASAEELQRIKLYGLVSIAEDKLDSWGPWSAFEAPAAGESVATPSPRVNAGETYRTLPQTSTPSTSFGLGCLGGSICGFGAIDSYSYSEGLNNSGLKTVSATSTISDMGQRMAAVQFTGTVVEAGELSPLLPQSIRLQGTLLGQGAPLTLPDSGVLGLQVFTEEGLGIVYSRQTIIQNERGSERVSLSGSTYDQEHDVLEAQVANAYLQSTLSTYIAGTNDGPSGYSKAGSSGPVVIGFSTPDADMAALRASNATASYTGRASYYGSPVSIEVQFGQGTWQGTWNGGKDGYVNAYNGQLTGNVGFTAEGTINGVNFASAKVGTNDVGASVTGSVRGAFFGPQAAAAAGVVDITKTNPTSLAQPALVMMPTPTVSANPGYTEARHVSTFLTTRVNNSER